MSETGHGESEGKRIFREHYDQISEALLHPIQMSQHLYSVGCIGESTLDEMEAANKTSDERKAVLLRALNIAIQFDDKKLNLLADVLSQFEETSSLSERLRGQLVGQCFSESIQNCFLSGTYEIRSSSMMK